MEFPTTDVFYSPEMNSLENQGSLRGKHEEYFRPKENASYPNKSSTVTKSVTIPSIAIPTSVIVVSIIAISVTVLATGQPNIHLSGWNITYQSISFSFEADESTHPYLLSIQLLDERLASYEVEHDEPLITFDHLIPLTDYEILVENDWGEGSKPIATWEVKTRARPTFPNGIFTISSHATDQDKKLLTLGFSLNDPYHYLTDFRIEIADDLQMEIAPIVNYQDPFNFDISSFKRGFISIKVFGKSAHPSIGGAEILLTRYEVYY